MKFWRFTSAIVKLPASYEPIDSWISFLRRCDSKFCSNSLYFDFNESLSFIFPSFAKSYNEDTNSSSMCLSLLTYEGMSEGLKSRGRVLNLSIIMSFTI